MRFPSQSFTRLPDSMYPIPECLGFKPALAANGKREVPKVEFSPSHCSAVTHLRSLLYQPEKQVKPASLLPFGGEPVDRPVENSAYRYQIYFPAFQPYFATTNTIAA